MVRNAWATAWAAAGVLAAAPAVAQEHGCLAAPPVGLAGAHRLGGVAMRATEPSRLAFTNVNVLPMDSERVLAGQTVVVDGGLVASMGPSRSVRVPPGATVVDGAGGWLMPGLVDAHTHERALPDWPDDVAGNLVMYLANGVTTILNMGDFTGDMIGARESVRSGRMAGPAVVVGHFVRGPSDGGTSSTLVSNAAQARDLVRRARAEGYDFLKVYDGVPSDAYEALLAEGPAAHLSVTGHAVRQVGLRSALTRGQVMVAHAQSLLEGPGLAPESIGPTAEWVAGSGAAVTATLSVFELLTGFGLDGTSGRDPWSRVMAQDGIEYMDGRAIDAWVRMLQFRSDFRAPRDMRPALEHLKRLVKALSDAGVPILLGSDTIGVPGVVPGFSIHGELRLLREAGLTPWQALASGTRDAGAFAHRHLGSGERFGVVAEGARADLLLLDASPIEDPSVLRRPVAVVAAGRFYPREALAAHLVALSSRSLQE
jgi:hypothetical protein